MTRPQPCASCGGNQGGERWLCRTCAPDYEPIRFVEAAVHGSGITGPVGKHIAGVETQAGAIGE